MVRLASACLQAVLRVNECLSHKPKGAWAPRVHKALDKAKANKCWLGLDDYSWMDQLPTQP